MVLDGLRMGEGRAMDYEIGITGPIPDGALRGIDDVVAIAQPEATILTGAVTDQAALHGLINRLHSAGLELLEVRRPGKPSAGRPSQSRSGLGCPTTAEKHTLPEPYEFGIAGRIGPLIRSCLRSFTPTVEDESTVLTGTVRSPDDLHRMLDLLATHGLTAQEIRLTHHSDTTPPRNPGPNPSPAVGTGRSTSTTSPPEQTMPAQKHTANLVPSTNRTAHDECSGK